MEDIIPPSPEKIPLSRTLPLTRSNDIAQQEGETSNAELLADDHHQESAGSSDDEEDVEEEDEEEDEDWSKSELEEEPEEYATLQELYQRQKKGQTLLLMFFRHLQDINGGACKERQAMLHAQNVRKINQALDANGQDHDIECLVKDGGSSMWRNWAKPLLDNKSKRPGTIKSYFCSVAKFLDFILDHTRNEVEGMPEILEDSLRGVEQVLPRIRSWSSSINKLYATDLWSKILKDRSEPISPQNVEDMTGTKVATEAMSLLKKSQVAKVNDKEFVAIRDFLIARLQLENGQRPGLIESATLEEFQRAKRQKTGYIMHVAGHKNARLGPAPMYMSNNLYSNIKLYISHVRPSFADQKAKKCLSKPTAVQPSKRGRLGSG